MVRNPGWLAAEHSANGISPEGPATEIPATTGDHLYRYQTMPGSTSSTARATRP
jgi:hypothetical protein